ncbi:MarR family transcriptional regulator [Saccharopolyspora erythraea]|uniref:MarR family winged helix-turn-helix transcriptional regulator n=1 Tax=Saccharopolyspora erythraea TaxID=1836 RepID=UPI001BABDE56|nr:MarR family transcriptional regulator [Saccharopolyspora erythraea]QUH02852.1 MarR family transcriptional regulator [Saccharopolyspora erythraea]
MSSDATSPAAATTDPRPGDDEIITWWGLVIEGYHATQDRLMGAIADRFAITPAAFDILLRLVRSPDHRMPMTRLAREAALSSGGFTKVADRMAAAGLLRREPCPADRRVTYAALTDHGRTVAEQARATGAQVLRDRVLAPLGTEQAAALAEAMRTLREANTEQ